MAKFIPNFLKPTLKKFVFPIPKKLSKNFIFINNQKKKILKDNLIENYYVGWRNPENYKIENFNSDLNVHLFQRLENDRREIIPWLDSCKFLNGQKILEIGCGTGSSSIALSEQNAEVTGLDIDEGSIKVAQKRAEIYGLNINFKKLNSENLGDFYEKGSFDQIIFFASLEHMTLNERLNSLKSAWNLLNKDGFLTIIETPNRLWYFDGHTSMMPFFNWLPDDLAFYYSKFSKRDNFNNIYNDIRDKDLFLDFQRRGRGFSYHEIDLAICDSQEINVISSLSSYQGLRYDLRVTPEDRAFKNILAKFNKNIDRAFYDKFLYLVIKK